MQLQAYFLGCHPNICFENISQFTSNVVMYLPATFELETCLLLGGAKDAAVCRIYFIVMNKKTSRDTKMGSFPLIHFVDLVS